MQSDFILEKPEISSFAPKTSHHSETLDTSHGEISTDASGFYPSSTPFKTDAITTDRDENSLLRDQPCDANNDLVENGGRFKIPPPKYSDLYSLSSHMEGVESETSYEYYHANKSPRDLLVPQTSEGEKGIPPSAIQEQGEDTNYKHGNMGGTRVTKDAEYSESNLYESETNGESSIFTFPVESKSVGNKPELDEGKNNVVDENASNKDFKARRRARQRRKQNFLVESTFTDDETSIENYGAGSTSHLGGLQERSHQAWKSRQRKNGIMRSKTDDEVQSQKGSVVSFGASDTIYHFEADSPKQNKRTNAEQEEMSFDARSLNSEYTKSLESEVEDMFKDILFIGSPHESKPGRKKYRYKSEKDRKTVQQRSITKKHNRAKVVESAYKVDEKSKSVNDSQYSTEESTKYSQSKLETDTIGDETYSLGSTVSGESSDDTRTVETNQSEKETADDTLQTVMGLVEGGISVMTSALEYAFREEEEEEEVEPRRRGNVAKNQGKGKKDYDLFETCGLDVCDQRVEPVSTREIFSRSKNGVPRSALSDPSIDDINQSPSDEGRRKYQRHMQQAAITKLVTENEMKPDRSILNLGSGGELVQLAMHAARTVHKLKGVEYNESNGIDMYNDVKKIHVTLGLPLGIIFLENDGGCFVTKVSRDGSAAKSRRVMVGDQLALINGTSGYKMKVDDICDAVSNSTDRGQVELVFLRYIGPFRPSTVTERGNDVPMDIKNVIANKPRTRKESSNKKPTKRKKAFRIFGKKKA